MSYLSYRPIELSFGTSGLRGLVADMTDLECYINTTGFLRYLESEGQLSGTVYIAGDLRSSTSRIMSSVMKAVDDFGQTSVNCGFIPTPALAFYALSETSPCIMVTGSHIPDDRNGIKFYRADGEVLKAHETDIKRQVSLIRESIQTVLPTIFNEKGMFHEAYPHGMVDNKAELMYEKRYTDFFASRPLTGKKVIIYQHSAVGRDMLAGIVSSLGAIAIPEGRSEKFIPIDTENVTKKDAEYFQELASKHSDCFAIVSTDGDSDRPFVIDEKGTFYRGDILGALVADYLSADFAAYPVSSSDMVDKFLDEKGIERVYTRIGSPYVIDAMSVSKKNNPVGWEVNGGFLIGGDIVKAGAALTALPTRDAVLPILVALTAAAETGRTLSSIFAPLCERFTQAGMIDDFPVEESKHIISSLSGDINQARNILSKVFNGDAGFSTIDSINTLDGVRVYFSNGDILHLRPSGNAPQFRVYSVSDSQIRADEIVELCIATQGLLHKLRIIVPG